jgi:alpha-galactosidase
VIKHDFTTFDILGRWGHEMGAALTNDGWTFRDNSKTTAEVILGLYQAIREGCGDDADIIACNAVSHLSAGLFEYYRVGDDSGNNFERAMKYGPNPFAFRLPQHQAFYAVDPDCIANLKEISWRYNRQFVQLIAASGALLQLSTRLGNLGDEQREVLRDACKRIGRTRQAVEPLDWMERSIPARWRIGSSVVELTWDRA